MALRKAFDNMLSTRSFVEISDWKFEKTVRCYAPDIKGGNSGRAEPDVCFCATVLFYVLQRFDNEGFPCSGRAGGKDVVPGQGGI